MRHTPNHIQRGFTLIEMLVVISIVILLAVITIPAFTAMVSSSHRVQAQESLKRAMALGHDLALRSADGRDVGMVFIFEPPGPLMILPCVRTGEIDDAGIRREVFVPIPGAEPVALPVFWTVRGYAPGGFVDAEWYEPATGDTGTPRYRTAEPAWVFPETSLYDVNLQSTVGREGLNRQTFMVRFEGSSGRMLNWPAKAVIVVSPRPSSADRTVPDPLRADLAQDLDRWVRRIVATSDLNADGMADAADQLLRSQLLGDQSADTILVKPVSTIGLCDERRLAAALGVTIDRTTGCLYRYNRAPVADPPPDPYRPSFPEFVVGVRVTDENINRWMEGDTNGNDTYPPFDLGDEPQSLLFTINRFTGQAQAVSAQPATTGSN